MKKVLRLWRKEPEMGGADHHWKVVKKVKETKALCVCVCDCKISPEDIVNSSGFQQANSHLFYLPNPCSYFT